MRGTRTEHVWNTCTSCALCVVRAIQEHTRPSLRLKAWSGRRRGAFPRRRHFRLRR